jgi:hypothetical protein
MRSLGQERKNILPGIQQTNGLAIAAVPNGVLVCVGDNIVLYRLEDNQVTNLSPSTPVPCKAVETDDSGSRAFVLSECDVDKDSQLEDCLTDLDIGVHLTVGSTLLVDPSPDATMLAVRGDGRGVVVVDSKAIHGVWYDVEPPGPPHVTHVGWPESAEPVGIDRGDSSLEDLFAVGDAGSKQIWFMGFDPASNRDLERVSLAKLENAPTALAFGRRSDLYVAAGKKLHMIKAELPSPAPNPVDVTAANPITKLLVQP